MATGTITNNTTLVTLFSAATTNGNSAAMPIPFSEALLVAQGTWGGATVTLMQSSPDGTYIPVDYQTLDSFGQPIPISLTADAAVAINYIVFNQKIYAVISGATGTTSLTVTLQRTH